MVTQDKLIPCKGDHVVYKKRGIYLIADIKKEKIAGELKCYYVLKSVYDSNSAVYVPADNEELVSKMERVLTKAEIEAVIESSHYVQIEYCKDTNTRQTYYEEVFGSDNLSVVIALMKTLLKRKEETQLTKERFPAIDERALGNCQRILCEAFAFSLEIPKSDLVPYILDR